MRIRVHRFISLLLLSATHRSCQGQRPEETVLQIVQSTTELSEVSTINNIRYHVTIPANCIHVQRGSLILREEVESFRGDV